MSISRLEWLSSTSSPSLWSWSTTATSWYSGYIEPCPLLRKTTGIRYLNTEIASWIFITTNLGSSSWYPRWWSTSSESTEAAMKSGNCLCSSNCRSKLESSKTKKHKKKLKIFKFKKTKLLKKNSVIFKLL